MLEPPKHPPGYATGGGGGGGGSRYLPLYTSSLVYVFKCVLNICVCVCIYLCVSVFVYICVCM